MPQRSHLRETVRGKTAFVIVQPDGALLGGGLFLDDLSPDLIGENSDIATLTELLKAP